MRSEKASSGFYQCMESARDHVAHGPGKLQTARRAGKENSVSLATISAMIIGAHVLLNSERANEDRAFFRDVLNFPSVDAGRGWLIFGLPPAEVAIHPIESRDASHKDQGLPGAVLYLMCDDLNATIAMLKTKNVSCSAIKEERWGSVTSIVLPSGSEIGLYQPKHPLAIAT